MQFPVNVTQLILGSAFVQEACVLADDDIFSFLNVCDVSGSGVL